MKILAILNELAETPSTNEKEAILRREKDNDLLKRVFQAAYNPMITYGIKQIPEYEPATELNYAVLKFGLEKLQKLVSREKTGNDAIWLLHAVLSSLLPDDAIVLERIIQRDLRCGTSDTLASRVWPGLVPTFDVMLAHKDISGIKYPAYAQVKSDGARCHMSLQAGKAVAFSRNGKPIELHGVFDSTIKFFIKEGETLDGELVAIGKDGEILDRKTGNGIVNKAVKGTISKEEVEMLQFHTWDIVDFTSTIPYKIRIKRLSDVITPAPCNIKILSTEIVNSEDEAYEFYNSCRAAGEEGAMIKNMDSKWVPKRSKDIGKMKAVEVADLVIVALEEGGGKYQGMLGAFVCETSDGKLRVSVGTGLSDSDRGEFANSAYIGRVIEVAYNEKIQDKKTEKWSLFLPRFLSLREDKFTANTLEELK